MSYYDKTETLPIVRHVDLHMTVLVWYYIDREHCDELRFVRILKSQPIFSFWICILPDEPSKARFLTALTAADSYVMVASLRMSLVLDGSPSIIH